MKTEFTDESTVVILAVIWAAALAVAAPPGCGSSSTPVDVDADFDGDAGVSGPLLPVP